MTQPGAYRIGAAASAASLLLIACVAGDGALRVRGHVADPRGEYYDTCKIELYMENSKFIDASIISGSEFLTTFVVEPTLQTYQFRIGCEGATSVYTSKAYDGGTLSTYYTPIDLGRVILE